MQHLPITSNDFAGIGVVAQHCDSPKMQIALHEALNFDLCAIYKQYGVTIKKTFIDCLTNQNTDENYLKLYNGETYTNNKGVLSENLGLKNGILYYAYSRYLIVSSINDTASGIKQLDNQFSIPTPLKEVQAMADKWRNMGLAALTSTVEYICYNKELFPELKELNCKQFDCRCGDNKECYGTSTKGFGFKSSNISKHDVHKYNKRL